MNRGIFALGKCDPATRNKGMRMKKKRGIIFSGGINVIRKIQ